MNLKELRKKIDMIDNQVIELLIERFKVVEKIMLMKTEIEDKDREKEILGKIECIASSETNPEFYKDIYKMIFTESKNIQKKLSN